MISTQQLLLDIDNKLNKLASLEGQYIPDETKIDILNKSQIKLILKKIGLNNDYQLGLDAFKKRYEDLEILIVPYEKLKVTKVSNDILNSYVSDLTITKETFFLPIDSYTLCHRGNCKNRILNVIQIVKHADLQTKLLSPHWKPSFEYQESLATISQNNFYTYSDTKNTFLIDALYLSYLRYPVSIDVAGYIHLDGKPSIDKDCELDSYLEDELVNIACKELGRATGNEEVAQNSEKGEKENE